MCLAKRQRNKSEEVADENEEKGCADEREPGVGAGLHGRLDNAVAGQRIEKFHERLEPSRLSLEATRDDHCHDGDDRGGQPQIDDCLRDREIERTDRWQLDERPQLELLGYLHGLAVTPGNEVQAHQGRQPQHYPHPQQRLSHDARTPSEGWSAMGLANSRTTAYSVNEAR